MEEVKKKAVIISCFGGWYNQRLKPIKSILEKHGYTVNILLSDYDHTSKKKIEKEAEECTYLHVLPYKRNISIRRVLSHINFGYEVYRKINDICPNLIYLVLPPNITAFYCLKYKQSHREIKYIIDLIDLWPESMPVKKYKKLPVIKLWRKLRDDSLAVADYVITECFLYRKRISHYINKMQSGVLYLFREQELEEERYVINSLEKYNSNESSITLAYLGSINNIIDLSSITTIVRLLMKTYKNVIIHIIGDGESREVMIKRLSDIGAEVLYHGKIFDELQKSQILCKCDFGINMMKADIAVGLTIKSVDYFAKGLPIINNIQGDTWSLVEKKRIGINYDGNTKSFLHTIQNFDREQAKIEAYRIYKNYFTLEAFEKKAENNLEFLWNEEMLQ